MLKNCATCKFMNFRCKGECGECVNRVVDNPGRKEQAPSLQYKGGFYKEEATEEKCKCIECFDEDSGKYKYWEGAPELMKYFGNAEYGMRGAE